MELSIFLAKLLGTYMIIKGIALIVRKKEMKGFIADFVSNKTVAMFASAFALIIGLAIVIGHNVWTSDWRVLITIIGWIVLIEGLLMFVLPHKKGMEWVSNFTKPAWYNLGIMINLFLGIYLALIGYGL
ncbi:MAG: hypothetical protein ACI9GH_000097 [Candidatus Paceibacteria bacterium]|jgi:hypothetical protein